MERPLLVLIEWEDSAQASPHWQWLSECQAPKIAQCISVGFLVADEGGQKSLAVSLANVHDEETAQASGIISIPERCIRRMETLTSSYYCPSDDQGAAS